MGGNQFGQVLGWWKVTPNERIWSTPVCACMVLTSMVIALTAKDPHQKCKLPRSHNTAPLPVWDVCLISQHLYETECKGALTPALKLQRQSQNNRRVQLVDSSRATSQIQALSQPQSVGNEVTSSIPSFVSSSTETDDRIYHQCINNLYKWHHSSF